MSFSLYELTSKYLELMDYIELNDQESNEAFEETLQALEDSIEDKAHNVAGFIKSLESELEGLKRERNRLEERMNARKNKIQRLKEYLKEQLELADIKKVNTKLFTVWVQNNPQSVRLENVDKIPKDYFIEREPKLNTQAILDDLKEGKEIDGVEIKQTRGVRIR